MSRIFKIFVVFLLSLSFAIPVNAIAAVDANFTILVNSAASKSGQVVINLNGENLSDLYAYEAVLTFEPQNLELIKSEAAMKGFSISPQVAGNNVYIAFTKVGNIKGIDGSALLSKITFKRKNSNPVKVSLESVKTVNSSLVARTYNIEQTLQDSIYIQNPKVSDNKLTATASLSSEKYNELLENAIVDGSGIKSIFLEINSVDGVLEYVQQLPSLAFTSKTPDKSLIIRTPFGIMTLPGNIFERYELGGNETVAISFKLSNNAFLQDDFKKLVGNSTIIELSITSGNKTISSLNNNLRFDLPYRIKSREDENAVVACSIDERGKAEVLQNSRYSKTMETASFSTNHLSKFAAVYNKVTFSDVNEKSYYYSAATYLAARNITSGTGGGLFSPKADLTRGQFIVMVMKAYDIAPDVNSKDNFSDAGDKYYTGYLAAAKRMGLSSGTGNNMFGPNKKISRQEAFTLLYNILKVTDNLHDSESGKELKSFKDSGEIAPYAKEAMSFFVKGGYVGGNNSGIDPKGITDRAQFAQVLYNLLTK